MRSRAKASLDRGQTRLRRWWSKKYNRPANDPLFDERSEAEHYQEFLEDLWARREELADQLRTENSDPKEAQVIMKALAEIDKALGEEEEEDPKIAEWEAALERGEDPDWD